MTPDELLKQLYDDTLVGNGPAVLELTNTGLGMGLGPETLLYDALIPALEAELEAVRQRGYAVIDGELEPGLVAVAAPVYRDGGAVVAALSVSGPGTRLTPARAADVACRCVAVASALSAVLGHRQKGPPGLDAPALPQREGAA